MPVLKYLDPIAKIWRPVSSTPGVALSDAPACVGTGVAGNVANATFSVIGMATPTRDPDGLWNGLGVTVKRTGVYIITGSLTFQYSGGTGEGIFYVGPSSTGADSDGWAADSVTFKSGAWGRCSIATSVYLTAGSTIYWGAYQSSGGTVAVYNIDLGVTLQVAGTPGPQGPPGPPHTFVGMELGTATATSFADTTYQALPLSSAAVVRSDGGMTVVGDAFVVPVEGWYEVDCNVTYAGADDTWRVLTVEKWNAAGSIKIRKALTYHNVANTADMANAISKGLYLLAGERVSFEAMRGGGSAQAANVGINGASCVLVGGARGPVGPPGLVSATSGIQFPATQSPSNDPNTFDDYEEGPWAPIFAATSGGTPTMVTANTKGRYQKVGRWVTLHGSLNGRRGSLSGLIRVSGLPFPLLNEAGQWQAFAVGWFTGFLGFTGNSPLMWGDPGASVINVGAQINGSASVLSEASIPTAADCHLIFSGTYETDA